VQNLKSILLIEDDRVDEMRFRRALKELEAEYEIVHSVDGEQALEHLRSDSNNEPCVIFLDLAMPKMDGYEFLKIVKADMELRHIPVIVLTSSSNENDRVRSLELGAMGYVVKSVDYEDFVEALRSACRVEWTTTSCSMFDNGEET
jgi:CheY-like chemotaxis protein